MSPFLLHIIAINLLDLVGIICAKYWFLTRHPAWLVATVVLFGGAGYVFAKSLRYEGMAIANVLWIAISIILVTIAGYFLFKENISATQFIGMGIIVAGLVVINL